MQGSGEDSWNVDIEMLCLGMISGDIDKGWTKQEMEGEENKKNRNS